MRWPLHVVGVAHGGRWVELSLNCPPQHELARLLRDLSKIYERVVWRLVSGFFCELSPSHRHELLTGLNLALGDRPVTDVLLDPERSALMGQEHLQATVPAAPEQHAGTRAPRFVRRHTHLLAHGSVELAQRPGYNVIDELCLGPRAIQLSPAGAERGKCTGRSTGARLCRPG